MAMIGPGTSYQPGPAECAERLNTAGAPEAERQPCCTISYLIGQVAKLPNKLQVGGGPRIPRAAAAVA